MPRKIYDIKPPKVAHKVEKELKEFLTKNKMLNDQKVRGKRNYFVTDYTERFVKVAEIFLGHKIEGNLNKIQL